MFAGTGIEKKIHLFYTNSLHAFTFAPSYGLVHLFISLVASNFFSSHLPRLLLEDDSDNIVFAGEMCMGTRFRRTGNGKGGGVARREETRISRSSIEQIRSFFFMVVAFTRRRGDGDDI